MSKRHLVGGLFTVLAIAAPLGLAHAEAETAPPQQAPKQGQHVEPAKPAPLPQTAPKKRGGIHQEQHGKREAVTVEQLPKAVRDTLMQEIGRDSILKIESETEGGVALFEAHIKPEKGNAYTVRVDAAGKFIGKAPAEEEKK